MKIRKYIAFLALLSVAIVHAEDWTKYGLKGKVVKSVITSNNYDHNVEIVRRFNLSGHLVDLQFQDLTTDYGRKLNIAVERNRYTSDVKNGKISTIRFDSDGQKCVLSYHYGQNGQLSEITYVENWTTSTTEHISATAQMNDAVAKAKKLKSELDKLQVGTAAYNRKMAEYQAAVKKATVNNFGGQNVVHTQNHSSEGIPKYFSDYEFDELGNWIKRQVKYAGARYTEYQYITYDSDYYSSNMWPIVEKSGDLTKVVDFYDNEMTNSTFKQKAKDYWNSRILDSVYKECGNQLDCLVNTALNPICSNENKEKILDSVRVQVYDKEVAQERDFAKLRQVADKKIAQIAIFNEEYRSRILKQADQMYNDSVAYLEKQVVAQLDIQDYKSAQATSLQAMKIAPGFEKYRAEAEYQLLMGKKADGEITSADCEEYRKDNPNSLYDEDVAKLYNHLYTVENRGKFVHFSVEGGISFGKGMYEANGGIGILLGWHYTLLNFYTGVQYGGFGVISGGQNGDLEKQDKGGHFSGQHVTIPAVLRFNLKRSFTENYYVGLGANLNFAATGYLGYADKYGHSLHIKDKALYNHPFFLTPRFAVGYSSRIFEIELYGLCEVGDILNEDLINKMVLTHSDYKFNMDKINSQMDHRFRAGIAFRYLF